MKFYLFKSYSKIDYLPKMVILAESLLIKFFKNR